MWLYGVKKNMRKRRRKNQYIGNENRFAQLIQNASDGMHSIAECKHGSSHLACIERKKEKNGGANNSNNNNENYILRSVSCY